MTFRLTTLLYLFAIVASSMAVLGVWGLVVGLVVFAAWVQAVKYSWQNNWYKVSFAGVVRLFFALGFVLLIGLFFSPALTFVRTPSPRTMTSNNLRNLTLAIQHYHATNGHYPPPYVTDKTGTPLYSWRALLLSRIECPDLANQFRYDQPWNSPSNLALLQDISQFQSPRFMPPYGSHEPDIAETHYFAIVGDETIWDPNKKVTESDVTDGLDQTMLLIEVKGTGIKWSEPRDFTLEEALELLRDAGDEEWIDSGYFVSTRYDRPPQSIRYIAFADGRVTPVYSGNDPVDLRAMLTRSGGEEPRELLDWSKTDKQKPLGIIIHWGRIWGLVLWLAIILLPLNRRLAIFPIKPT